MEEGQEPKNSLWRRAEQITRWKESDTNKESDAPKQRDQTRVKFQDGCVFLAACSSGDTEEVEKLLARGADINTYNIDGLTALHQACIDDNLHMVTFLVEHGADIDFCDNEGWTALHATASCGFLDIAQYLIEHGASVAAVNNDGELPIDIFEGEDMEELLVDEMDKLGVDAEAARCEEEQIMLRDAKSWLNNKLTEVPHPKTGATALHVASAKGYIKVMNILLQAGVDIDVRDYDGWTPLHAAAHWGQEEACKILVENFCSMDIKNVAGQPCFEVADTDLVPFLKELKQKQATLKKDRDSLMKDDTIIARGGHNKPLVRRSSVTRMSVDQKHNINFKSVEEERAQLEAIRNSLVEKDEDQKSESSSMDESSSESETEKQNEINRQSVIPKSEDKTGPPRTVTVDDKESQQEKDKDRDRERDKERDKAKENDKENEPEMDQKPSDVGSISDATSPPPRGSLTPRIADMVQTDTLQREADKENERNSGIASDAKSVPRKTFSEDGVTKGGEPESNRPSVTTKIVLGRTVSAPSPRITPSVGSQGSSLPQRPLSQTESDRPREDPSSWRAGLRKTGSSSAVPDVARTRDQGQPEKLARSASSPWLASERRNTDDITRRRPVSVTGTGDTQEVRNRFNDLYSRTSLIGSNKPATTTTTTEPTTSTTSTTSTTTVKPYQSSYVPLSRRRVDREEKESSPTSPTSGTAQRRSFEPPKRDEERETERKLKAKRARESRRSTQGVSKEDLMKAEQTLQAAGKSGDQTATTPSVSERLSSTSSDDTPTSLRRRQPLEDRNEDDTRNSYSSIRRPRDTTNTDTTSSYLRSSRTSTTASTTSPTSTTTTTTSSTPSSSTDSSLPYRSSYRSKYLRNDEDVTDMSKVDDKEDKGKEDPSQKSAAIRTRRKRESRRPTGKVTAEDLQGITKTESSDDKSKETKEEDRTTSRYGSSRYSEPTGSSAYDRSSSYSSRADRPTSYSGRDYSRSYSSSSDKDIDYKKLYEEEKGENERLRKETKRLEQDLAECRSELERFKAKGDSSRSYESSAEKRERRAMERKMSELEEELKEKEVLRADNQRLKDENGALIRVISKLSK